MTSLSASNNILDEILNDLRHLRDNDTEYITPNQETKQTIILLGGSRVGKTTIVEIIKDSLYYPTRWSQYWASTNKPVFHEIGGLRMVDTPNIFDLQNQLIACSITKKDLTIKNKTIDFPNGILPLFALVFNVDKAINSADITALLNFKNKFSHMSRQMMLVLTHCEEKSQDQRRTLIDEFFGESRLANAGMRSFFERGILCMGCIRYKSVEQCDRQTLSSEHREVLQMRAQFIRSCQENEIINIVNDSERCYCCWSIRRVCCLS
jgi:GTPase SAR1 family protein